MHEMGIAQQICSIVESSMAEHKGQNLKSVSISVGTLSGVNPDSLRFCMDHIIPCSILAGAQVIIREEPGLIRCNVCDFSGEAAAGIPVCGACHSPMVDIISGLETVVETIDLT